MYLALIPAIPTIVSVFVSHLRSHNALQHYDGLKAQRLSTRLAPSDGGRRSYMEMLDELTLEHMTQDCSLLKNQLLRLKTLLQVGTTQPLEGLILLH